MFLLFFHVFVFQNFFCNVDWTIFALLKGPSNILSNNPYAEKLHASEEKDQDNDRGIAGNVDTGNQFFEDNDHQVDQGCNSGKTPKEGSCSQRLGGITDDAVDSVIE